MDRPIVDGFHCWVGLNEGLHRTHLNINPFVGVHVVPLMKMAARLEGRSYRRSTATYAIHMGEIAPDEYAFEFTEDTDIEAESERLARLYDSVGFPYAKSLSSYEAILPLLESRLDMLGGYPERVAICLLMLGRRQEALACVDEVQKRKPNYFGNFVSAFRAEVNGSAQ